MYFDRRLWQFTKGVRLRIAGAVFIGVLAAAVGVARLALLGWLLAKVFQGAPFDTLIVPFAIVALRCVSPTPCEGGIVTLRALRRAVPGG